MPVREIALTVRAELPLLVSVTVLAVLVVLTTWFPKETEVGDRETVGAVPVPLRVTVCGLPLASSLTERVPPRGAVAVGAKVILIVQLPFTDNVDGETGQVVV